MFHYDQQDILNFLKKQEKETPVCMRSGDSNCLIKCLLAQFMTAYGVDFSYVYLDGVALKHGDRVAEPIDKSFHLWDIFQMT